MLVGIFLSAELANRRHVNLDQTGTTVEIVSNDWVMMTGYSCSCIVQSSLELQKRPVAHEFSVNKATGQCLTLYCSEYFND